MVVVTRIYAIKNARFHKIVWPDTSITLKEFDGNSHCPRLLLSDKMGLVRSKIVSFPSEHHKDLVWSFLPIFYLMRILGIDLIVSQSASKFRRYFFLAFVLITLTFTEAVNSILFNMNFTYNSRDTKLTIFWVNELRNGVQLISNVLLPVVSVYKSFSNWKSLWMKVQKIEHELNFEPSFLWELRKVVIGTSAILVTFILLVKLGIIIRFVKIKPSESMFSTFAGNEYADKTIQILESEVSKFDIDLFPRSNRN